MNRINNGYVDHGGEKSSLQLFCVSSVGLTKMLPFYRLLLFSNNKKRITVTNQIRTLKTIKFIDEILTDVYLAWNLAWIL